VKHLTSSQIELLLLDHNVSILDFTIFLSEPVTVSTIGKWLINVIQLLEFAIWQ